MLQILQFVRLLQSEKIPFIAIGMSAARLHGAPVVTQDFDLWVPPIEANVLERLASKANALLSGGREPPCAVNFTEGPPIDLVRRVSTRLAFDYALRISRKVRVQGITIPLLPLEEIIRSKVTAGRAKDRAALPALRAFLRTQQALKRRAQPTHRRQ